MATRHATFRIDDRTFERLDARSRERGQSRSRLASTLIEEGLRMEAHPGITFRDGPAGRRPALAGGPDVWVVARLLRDARATGEDAVERAVELSGLSEEQVRTGARYYAQYQQEIDEWLDRLDREAEEAESAWRRERALLGNE